MVLYHRMSLLLRIQLQVYHLFQLKFHTVYEPYRCCEVNIEPLKGATEHRQWESN